MTITDHIDASGRTRAEICTDAGISRAMLSLIEKGERQISPARATDLAKAIGISPVDLRPDLARIFSSVREQT